MTRWPISRIQSEIARLDQLTGLNGRELTIRINKGRGTLGSFDRTKMSFTFSSRYFEDEGFSESEALDTIRHEYAHYMDWMIYGDRSDGNHGRTWKECCRRVGAVPLRCYDRERNKLRLRQEKELREKQKKTDAEVERFTPGTGILHPSYGKGVIRELSMDGLNTRATVDFPEAGIKILGLNWVSDHCSILTEGQELSEIPPERGMS